jgi:D-glycero-alpha-D-manno-heptose-7-phosphate kinase
MTRVELKPLSENEVRLEITDLNYKKNFNSFEAMMLSNDPELTLVQKVVAFFKPQTGFELKTVSESPVGGGLGGSSSLTISLIKAFLTWQEKKLSTIEMVELAHNLEAQVLKRPTGTQDYIPACEKGLNIIHYTPQGLRVEKLEHQVQPLFDNLLLVYTGKAHHSGINNWQVIKSVIDEDAQTLSALRETARIANSVASVCRLRAWERLPALFKEEFSARVKLSAGFSSPEIERLNALALENGALATKICGAGGGGTVLLWAEKAQHARLESLCLKSGFQPIPIRPVV